MRYAVFLCLFFVLQSPLQALQLQVRAFHSQAKISQTGAIDSTQWSGSYLNGSSRSTQSSHAGSQTTLNSPGQDLSLGLFLSPYFLLDLGLAQTIYYPDVHERIETLSPKLGLQVIGNVQGRWMPFLRTGLSWQQMKFVSNRIENRRLPASLGLNKTEDRFGISKEWPSEPKFLNGDLGFGCKFFLYPTTAFNLEYRYSASFYALDFLEREEAHNSFQNQADFITVRRWTSTRFEAQELSLAIETEI
ncbi:MAG: hypothetical protein NTX25_20220 [Proteobacteria bacterium]|nr:hypothetical protein [Pseudomonadota bacterium]